jgi:hypothetical protein
MKKILLIIAAVALVAVSCKKEPKNVPVPVTVSLEMNGAAYAAADVTVTLRDLNGTASFEAKTDAAGTAEFNVLPGFYEATASFKVAEEGSLYVYNGVNSNITVVKDGVNANALELIQSVTNQLVIKELYVGGCTSDDGSKSFQNDAYVIVYNNSDTPADASKLCFAGIAPANAHASNKYLVNGSLTYASQGWLPAAQAFWWFETQVTVEPWSQIVIAMKGAIDHTATYSNSVDLSNADYTMYDPESGFNPDFPFQGRDPRFYHDIVFDGFQYLHGAAGDREAYVYCQLFTGGNMRPIANGSRTGYFIQKLVPHTCNVIDRDYDWGAAVHVYLPYMRLADVYLMYAEAAAAKDAGFSRSNKASNCTLTSEAAINKVRARVGAGGVHPKFTGNAYMDEIRRERAVELMFEGHRFSDLQRWLLLTEAPYTIKTSQEFDRVLPNDWYTSGTNDPRDAQVANWREEVILERVFGTKHYWFPLPDSEVYLYEAFAQNPGW